MKICNIIMVSKKLWGIVLLGNVLDHGINHCVVDAVDFVFRFERLGKFFDSLDSSIRLLRLKGSTSTYTNIRPKIEYLTDRRFSYAHLAQLKFLLPNVIEIKKVLIHDEQTSCMKPDLHVTLNVYAIKDEEQLKPTSWNSQMRNVFHARLLDFFKAHPEGEVPEAALPEPFNQSKQDVALNSSFGETSTAVLAESQPARASHLSQSFRKHLSMQVSRNKVIDYQEKSIVSPQPLVLPVSEPRVGEISSYALHEFSLQPPRSQESLAFAASETSVQPYHPPTTPSTEIDSTKNEVCSSIANATICESPSKLASSPVELTNVSPALHPEKRGYMCPSDDSTNSPSKLVRLTHLRRSLKFDNPVKSAKVEDEVKSIGRLSVENDIFKILPENLLQSIREKEKKATEEQDPAISQAKKRQQMVASLPKLFNAIHFLFQSMKRSVITKEELMHRIIANHLDVVDRREVEEELELLQELVPESIYVKSASSGDVLVCINMISSPELMHAKLVEIK
ncbi:CDT1-like protein a, chloroplastic isoform X2 [Rhododendron vialii]|uniref:CDT1-like protein a, chloroplastic isoform X2 n=1 Tax=Rhododendron vialii TaxID=182163 RepID=UPI00265FA569|nr:CDT1-like protein a, chloroplastic isoform X2 [Rhododendron vialii]